MGVWIDTDVGFDDITALLIVRHLGLEIDGVSIVFGNTVLEQVRRNAASTIKTFNFSCPFYVGRSKPVTAEIETAERILGASGMPTTGMSLPDAGDIAETTHAFNALCDWLENQDGEKRILALGPLTNIAALALARPDLAAKIDDLVWMGGGKTTGNHTASAEFNALADPEALAIVLSHGLPLKMVELDFCRKVLMSPADVEPIRNAGGRNAQLLADLTAGFVNIAVSRGRPAMSMFDPAAAVAFARSDLVTFERASIAVELAGTFTRGRTVVETRAGHGEFNAAYVADGDFDAIREIILDTLVTEASK